MDQQFFQLIYNLHHIIDWSLKYLFTKFVYNTPECRSL